ncbi:hypothetical protein ES288_D04G021300v1 [Gossypium darwinii]|uniref:Uncharacterized protein n=1 Tax=Gossypium darwinii TaxID=34276 RepID=A0A5D2CS96_GOSDA|nr:hypothetical protein ES288_D04G021300v1 [Gossypium darwinii]
MKLLHVHAFPIILFFLFLFCSACGKLIKALPGQPAKQYSGYILTQPQHGRALFYYFVEADFANPCTSFNISNMLYLESPIRVGFSYSNTSSHYLDNMEFLLNWFQEFLLYKNLDLYLSGGSYAVHYIPQLVDLILNYNKRFSGSPIKLKAIAVNISLPNYSIVVVINHEFLWSHGDISDESLILRKTMQ